MNPCELPPCPPCPPPPYPPCPQVCGPPPQPPLPPCRPKPTMRGLHWAQTKRKIFQALVLSAIAGTLVYTLVGLKRREAYRDFYE
ncbi:acrosin-like [Trichoplusia ni]|nr:acrosin-like [Trichoplusia ni]